MTRTDSTTPIWGKIAIVALILMVVCGYLFEILIAPFGGLDFSIYRMGAMTIFDNEGSAVCGSRLPALCVPAA